MMSVPLSPSQALSGGNLLALPVALAGGVLAGLFSSLRGSSWVLLFSAGIADSPPFIYQCGLFCLRNCSHNRRAWLHSSLCWEDRRDWNLGEVRHRFHPYSHGHISAGLGQNPEFQSEGVPTRLRWAFGTGLLLSLVIGPCGTPVLASVLSYAAYKQNLVYGGLLLFLYGLGTGMPLVFVGTAAGGLLKRFDCSRYGRLIDPLIGSSLLLLGFYLLWRI